LSFPEGGAEGGRMVGLRELNPHPDMIRTHPIMKQARVDAMALEPISDHGQADREVPIIKAEMNRIHSFFSRLLNPPKG
jgi:hypothetical protein